MPLVDDPRLRSVLEALHEGVVVYGEGEAVVTFNARALELLGLSADELAGRSPRAPGWVMLDEDGRPLERSPVDEARSTQRALQRRVVVTGPSGRRTLVASATPLGPSGEVVLALTDPAQEIERHRFFELSDDLLLVARADGQVLHVNDGAVRVLGWPREALLGRGLHALLHPADVASANAVREGRASDAQLRHKHADGRYRVLSWRVYRDGHVVYARGVDVTEKIEREHALVRSQEELARAQDIASLATAELDVDARRIELSPRLAVLLGLEQRSVDADKLGAMVLPDDLPRARQAFERVLLGEPAELHVRVKVGARLVELRAWLRRERDATGEPGHVFLVVQDITEQRLATAKVRLTERLASMGSMAAGIAHEINNPLAFIAANLNVVRRELQAVPEIPGVDLPDLLDALREAQEGADRVRAIVTNLRSFTRVDELKKTPCDVPRVVAAALNMARNETRHRARVITRLEPVPPVIANEARLGQVFLNLLVNAAQAIPDGAAEQNAITVSTRAEEGLVIATVQDTGTGIPPEHLSRIFDPFFSTKDDGALSDLSLFVAQGLVRDLGGEIVVDSGPGRGTIFEVRLPAAHEPFRFATPSRITALPELRVLVVDDEPLILKAIDRFLGKAHALTMVQSGREALRLLAEGPFDLVICDLMMPDVSGIDVWEQVAPEQRERFIFMTGGTFTDRAAEFMERHQPPVLDKPFTLATLSALIKEVTRPPSTGG